MGKYKNFRMTVISFLAMIVLLALLAVQAGAVNCAWDSTFPKVQGDTITYYTYDEPAGLATWNYQWNYACTYVAWCAVKQLHGIELPGWGNACKWFDRAKEAGYSVGAVADGALPQSGCLAVWVCDDSRFPGHVAYVTDYDAKNKIMKTHEGGSTYTGNVLGIQNLEHNLKKNNNDSSPQTWDIDHDGKKETTTMYLKGYIFFCDHNWKNGVCQKCGCQLSYDNGIDYSCAGVYSVRSGQTAQLRTGPYQGCKSVRSISNTVENISIIGSVTNKVSNTTSNLWYKTTDGYYIYSERITKTAKLATSITISTGQNSYTANYGKDEIHLTGSISSSGAKIKNIWATLDGEYFFTPGILRVDASYVDLYWSKINEYLDSSKMSAGNHTLVICASDYSGGTVYKTIPITIINNIPDCGKPKITCSDVKGGKQVKITSATDGASITYSLDGGSYKTYTGPFTVKQTTTIAAKASKISMNTTSSQTTVQVYKVRTPIFNISPVKYAIPSVQSVYSGKLNLQSGPSIDVKYTGVCAKVAISCSDSANLWYSYDGVEYLPYTGVLSVFENKTVFAKASRNGYLDSDVSSTEVELTAPVSPKVKLSCTSKVAQGSSVTVQWSELEDALSYTVTMYCGGEAVESAVITDETFADFILENAADYSFSVTASNNFGTGEPGESFTVTAMPPSTVRFLDWDGTVLSEQKVSYGASAVAPADPLRTGYNFLYWIGSYQNVLEDTDIIAKYKIITYTVRYTDYNGNPVGDAQKVDYGHEATPPEESTLSGASESYRFAGWSISAASETSACDLRFVDSDMTAQAVFVWADEEHPIEITALEAKYDTSDSQGSYTVTATLENTNTSYSKGILRIALKTTDDNGVSKMVDTESQTVILRPGSQDNTYSFCLSYEDVATMVEAVVVGYEYDTQTGPAYSVTKTADVTAVSDYTYGEYSEWSTENPTTYSGWQLRDGVLYNASGKRVAVETKTQYRSSTKSTTTSTNASLSGWTQTGSRWVQSGTGSHYYAYFPSGYNTGDTYYNSYNKERIYNYETVSAKRTVSEPVFNSYIYWHWTYPLGEYNYNTYNREVSDVYNDVSTYGRTTLWYAFESTYDYAYNSTYGVYQAQISGYAASSYWWFRFNTYRQSYVNYTKYYDYYKWSEYGTWQDAPLYPADNCKVQTRTLYRYRVNDVPVSSVLTGMEDTSGTTYLFTNKNDLTAQDGQDLYVVQNVLPSTDVLDLEGKLAVVMVYRGSNTDPNESQLVYLGQIQIEEGNTFEAAFKTRLEPSALTGDFIVALSVQGSVGLVNIGRIQAPASYYTVTYTDEGGEVIGEPQLVAGGENAHPPEAPEIPGKTFVVWGETGTNVQSDLIITPVYRNNTYTVSFVDWKNETIHSFYSAAYGESLESYADIVGTPEAEGYDFNGWDWDFESDPTVTDHVVISAKYTPKTYTVRFLGTDGEPVSTQQVSYGEAASQPSDLSVSGMYFMGWSHENTWWNVTEDMDVAPIMVYEQTAMAPEANVDTLVLAETAGISLEAASNDAVIYYTLDGSVPNPERVGRMELQSENAQTEMAVYIGEDDPYEEKPGNGVTYLYDGMIELTETTTIRAISVEAGKNSSAVLDIRFVYCEEQDENQNVIWQDIGTCRVMATQNQEISLSILMDENPGLQAYMFQIETDPDAFYVDYDYEIGSYDCHSGDACKNGTLVCSGAGAGKWNFVWFSSEKSETSGSLLTLKLKTCEEANEGTYPVTLRYSPGNLVTTDDVVDDVSAAFIVMDNGLIGDANSDGYISTADILRILNWLVNNANMTEQQKICADVDGDGSVSLLDALKIAKYLVGTTEL